MFRGILLFLFYLCLAIQVCADDKVSVGQLLLMQRNNEGQISLMKSRAEERYYSNAINYSPWQTELNSTLEHRANLEEEFVGRNLVETSSTPLTSRVTQNTPFGFQLTLDYTKELGSPELAGFFLDQRYRGSLRFSLVQDFLGKTTQKVLLPDNYKFAVEKNVEAMQCLDVINRYADTYGAHQKLNISNDSLKDLKSIHKKVHRASQNGAVSKIDKMSMDIDIKNLESQIYVNESMYQDSLFELENLSGMSLKNKAFVPMNINYNSSMGSQKGKLKHIHLLKDEINLLEKRLIQVDLESQRDVSLTLGAETSEFSESVTNTDGQRSFEFIGIEANWRFGDRRLSNNKKNIYAQKSKRETELYNLEMTDLHKLKVYEENLPFLKEKISLLSNYLATGQKLEKRVLNRFKNGNSRYLEFISARNQVNSLRRSLVDIKVLFWKRKANMLFLSGNYETLCSGDM